MLADDETSDQGDDCMQDDSDLEIDSEDDEAEGPPPKAKWKKPMKSDGIEYTMVDDDKGNIWYSEEGKAARKLHVSSIIHGSYIERKRIY